MHGLTTAQDESHTARSPASALLAAEIDGENLTATDLAELMAAFNEVTAKLQVSHDQLTAEVARLTGRLREADEQLQRSRRLAALGEMAAGIAHEIRNPLGSIGLYASMLSEDLGDRPPERDVAEKIGRAVRGLDAIVTDVLAFAGDAGTRFHDADIREIVECAIEHAAIGAETRVEVRCEVTAPVCCDSGKIRQALVNILRNAAEAIEESCRTDLGGVREILVTVHPESLGGVDAVAVSVRDSGTGLIGEVTERMFNPFFTTRDVGTGLGLAIVHRIIDAHGGRVSVSNNGLSAGEGATVEILIPMRGSESGRTTRDTSSRETQG